MTDSAVETVVDVHAHVVPPTLLAGLADAPAHGFGARRTDNGWVVSVPGTGDTRPIGARMTEAGARRKWLAGTGVTRQVLSPWLDIQFGQTSPADARSWAQRLNDGLCEMVAGTGGDTVGLATVATDDGDQAAKDLQAALTRPELAGVVLNTNPVNGIPLHDPRLEPLWTVAEEIGAPIMLHPPTCGPSGDLTSLGTMGNVYGRLIDNTLAVTELILHGLLDRHPGLKLVLVHGGGFLPYAASRLDGGYRTKEAHAGDLARERPSAYLPDFWFDTVTLSGAGIGFLTNLVGAGHVLLGSDYPFALGDPDPAGTVRAAGLSAAGTEAILRGNATELFWRNA
ncbi:MAG TPA: amidohydrolase family protein [Pseudonocardiaceae bacterium]|nr:amidohydrolase family protein [Pseudonocardiaceae bacterium]